MLKGVIFKEIYLIGTHMTYFALILLISPAGIGGTPLMKGSEIQLIMHAKMDTHTHYTHTYRHLPICPRASAPVGTINGLVWSIDILRL